MVLTHALVPIGLASDVSQRHVGALSAKALLTSIMAIVDSHGGLSTGARTLEGLQRISEANLKHGRQTKEKLKAQRHSADVGRRVRAELKRIEAQLIDAGLMPNE